MNSSSNQPGNSKKMSMQSQVKPTGNKRKLTNDTPVTDPIWNHFIKIDLYLAVCQYCPLTLFYRTSTWRLIDHLKTAHHSIATDLLKAKGLLQEKDIEDTSNCSNFLNPAEPLLVQNVKINPELQKQIDRDLLELFINDCHSFDLVEGRAFQNFVSNIPGYVVPSKETISSIMIPSLYEEKLTEIKTFFSNNAQSLFVTVENWFVPKENYIVVTAHFIDEEYNQRHFLLACKGLGEKMEKVKICRTLELISEDWDFKSKAVLAMSDDHAYIEHALIVNGWAPCRCQYPSISSLFRRKIEATSFYSKIKKVVYNLKLSHTSLEYLQSYQITHNAADVPPKQIILDKSLCWTSTYNMMKRFLDLKDAVVNCVKLFGSNLSVITEHEWTIVKQTCLVLNVFKQITSQLTRVQFSPISMVVVVINDLKCVCNSILEHSYYKYLQPEVLALVKDIRNGLSKLPDLELDMKYAVCTLLDPRYKTTVFQNIEAIIELKNYVRVLIKDIMEKEYWNSINEESNVGSPMAYDHIMKHLSHASNQEINLYIKDEILPERTEEGLWNDPGQWWREHKSVYPHLAEIYRTKCNIIGTNVKTENHFSKNGLYYLDKNNFNSSEIEKIVFLNANLDPGRLDS